MEAKNKLTDCIKKIVFCDFDLIIFTLKDYYKDVYFTEAGSNAENIFEVQNEYDFKKLIEIYGLEFAVHLYTNCKCGYVIAGMNIPAERIILINTENYKGVFEKFADLIGERILNLYKDGYPLSQIKSLYCTIDIKKFLFGTAYKVTKTIFEGDKKIADVELTIEDDTFKCEEAILSNIANKVEQFGADEDFHYEVKKYGNTTEYINHTNNTTIRYKLKPIEIETI